MANPIEILMVEDNPADVELTREALSSGKLSNHLHVAEDGEIALDFLYQRGEYADAPRPDLIFLDLNLPKVCGKEVLADIKSHHSLKLIPVIILSSSEDAQDIDDIYSLNANSFVCKPVKVDDFIKVAQAIEHFWIEIVKLPGKRH